MSNSTTQFCNLVFGCIFAISLLLARGDGNLSTSGQSNKKIIDARQRIHPDFNFSGMENLERRLPGLPRLTPQTARRFLTLAGNMLDMKPEILLLITKKHSLLESFKPVELVQLDDYPEINKRTTNMKLGRQGLNSLLKLLRAAKNEEINLIINSAFRSYPEQKEIFTFYIQENGMEWTSKYSAPPGHSQHQLATTIDFARPGLGRFTGSTEEIWVRENANRFGWSLSYPMGKLNKTGYEWESWHWRWIGEDAVKMQNEFFEGTQQDTLEFWFLNCRKLRAAKVNRL